MEPLIQGLGEFLAWNPYRSHSLKKMFTSRAQALNGVKCLAWTLQMSPWAGRTIEVNEDEEADDFHAESVPHAIMLAPPWSLLRVTTDFEETMQPTWLIDKPLLIEGCLEKPCFVYFDGSDTIHFVDGGGDAKLRNFCIFAGGGSRAIRMDGGLQPWIESCKVILDDSESYLFQEAARLRKQISQDEVWLPHEQQVTWLSS